MRPFVVMTLLLAWFTASAAQAITKAQRKHETQGVSDTLLRQAKKLLAGTPTLQNLQSAHKLLGRAKHDYEGHRKTAAEHIMRAINAFDKDQPKKYAHHVEAAVKEIDTALAIK